MIYIYSYNQGSKGSKGLAAALGGKRIKHTGSNFKGSPNKIVINWGASSLPEEVLKCKVINDPQKIAIASNKLHFFKALETSMEETPDIPEWTQYPGEALSWLPTPIVARQKLQGHSAEGLVIIEKEEDFVPAPLYTKYVKKKHEFRVHVVGERVIDVQRKARRLDVPNSQVNWQVRNLNGGFIYAREGFTTPEKVKQQALLAIKAIGLDFGAVDILWNNHQERACVLEINTAPGLQGTTVELYANAFQNII